MGIAGGGRRSCLGALVCLLGQVVAGEVQGGSPANEKVEFNRDIRPILAGSCFTCHGPDANKRKAKLRLDTEEGAHAALGGRRAVVPGNPDASELLLRVVSDDDERMPPPKSGPPLTTAQVETLRRWIAQGAPWQAHWSLIPPRRPVLPDVRRAGWVRNPIDTFILARLEQEGLSPSPEADRFSLFRRVTLDLTGLPPTPAETNAFLADSRPDAYERVVDRLLASPRLGERFAARWLDAARYADTNGYQSDGERFMWRWRDWVIDALNRNMPFDQFTVEQLAGDLLPQPTLEQQIATGFNRNHRGNAEGGIIPEEYAVEYVADRVETTSTVWMGMTIGCARCHDHKYDPVSQADFYRLFAYFNNVPEKGRAVKFGNSPPMIKAPTPNQQARLATVERALASAERRFRDMTPDIDKAEAAWADAQQSRQDGVENDWSPTEQLASHLSLDGDADLPPKAAHRGGSPVWTGGKFGKALELDGQRSLDAGDIGPFGFDDKFTLSAWINAADPRGGTVISRMTDAPQGDGYAVVIRDGKIAVDLVKRWLDDALRVETESPVVVPGTWSHIAVTYDGSRSPGGVVVAVNGRPAKLRVLLDELNQTFATTEPLRIGGGHGPGGRFHGRIDEVRVYSRVLDADEILILATPESLTEIARTPAERRSAGASLKLRRGFLSRYAEDHFREAYLRTTRLRAERDRLVEEFPTTMVMQELPEPRPAFVLARGQYDRPGERVAPGIPASLAGGTSPGRTDRLGLARWLTDPSHPLTARVAVNRQWQAIFGVGLVKTLDDFGTQGEWPSHPDLLDWLASEFIASGWDVKASLRRIITSSTYRQSSRASASLRARDPENRLLARGPRLRLSAEMIRDQALAASGLLVERLGGPSVKPYQPEGLWRDVAEVKDYPQGHGEELYRRSLYTFWKRTVAPPSMVTFDAATRETCVVRESRTNTPLQALTLLNDVTYVEASRKLAERAMREVGTSPSAWVARAFRLVTSRTPEAEDLAVLLRGYDSQLARFRANPGAAEMYLSAGESPRNKALDPAELAATTTVAGVILNLDETITKE